MFLSFENKSEVCELNFSVRNNRSIDSVFYLHSKRDGMYFIV